MFKPVFQGVGSENTVGWSCDCSASCKQTTRCRQSFTGEWMEEASDLGAADIG